MAAAVEVAASVDDIVTDGVTLEVAKYTPAAITTTNTTITIAAFAVDIAFL